MQSSQSNVSFENQHRLSIGGRYTLGNVYRNPVSILLGTGINNSYIVIQKKKATEYYVSTGLNFGLRNNNVLSLGLKYKGQMKIPNGMQKENCFFPVPEYYFLRANLPRQDTIKCHSTEVIKIAVHLKKEKTL